MRAFGFLGPAENGAPHVPANKIKRRDCAFKLDEGVGCFDRRCRQAGIVYIHRCLFSLSTTTYFG